MTDAEQGPTSSGGSPSAPLKDLSEADLVVEAVVESLETKKALFRDLDAIVARGGAGDNTSQPVGHRDLDRQLPPRAGHPSTSFNPAPVQDPVEIVRTVVTEDQVPPTPRRWWRPSARTRSSAATRRLHRNLLLFGYLQPRRLDVRGPLRQPRDIGAAMRFGCGYPMGPWRSWT